MTRNASISSSASFSDRKNLTLREKLFGTSSQRTGLQPAPLLFDIKPVAEPRPAKTVRRPFRALLRKARTQEQKPVSDQFRQRQPVEYLGFTITNEQQSGGKWVASFVRMGGSLEWARRTTAHDLSHKAFADAKQQIDARLADPAIGQREFQRISVSLTGMIFAAGGAQECQLLDLSAGGARLHCTNAAAQAGELLLYIEGFGRYQASVLRTGDAELSVRFPVSDDTVLSLLRGLSNHVKGGDGVMAQLRKETRIAAPMPAVCRGADGVAIACDVIDASMRSMSIAMDQRPDIGALVTLGRTQARVIRHHERGVAVLFNA